MPYEPVGGKTDTGRYESQTDKQVNTSEQEKTEIDYLQQLQE